MCVNVYLCVCVFNSVYMSDELFEILTIHRVNMW